MADLNIELLVQKRQTRAAKIAIRELLSRSFTAGNVISASQWFRRLSLYRYGLNFLIQNEERFKTFDGASQQTLKLVTSEFLSAVGAAQYALVVVADVVPKTADDHEIVAGILLSNYDYERAHDFLAKAYTLYENKTERGALLCQLSMADCLLKRADIQDAISIAETVAHESKFPLVTAIAWQAHGQYLAVKGDSRSALRSLQQAEKLFPQDDSTYDFALLCRWLGYVYGKLSSKKKSREYFKRSTQIILAAKFRDEVWLEDYFLMKEVGVISAAEEKLLDSYPNARNRFSPDRAEARRVVGSKRSMISINLQANEYSSKGKSYLGVPMELKLLALLRLASDWGIDLERLKFLLWPEDIRNYMYLEQRVFLLLQRLRKTYSVNVYVKAHRVYLAKTNLNKVSVDQKNEVNSFLCTRTKFTAEDVTNYYCLKKSARTNYLKLWCEQGKIVSHGKGRATYYTVHL